MGIGSYRHIVLLQNQAGPNIPDGDGGFTRAWVSLDPAMWHCSIEPATARDLERVTAGSVISTASHILRGRFHPQVTTETRVTKGFRNNDGSLAPGAREFSVTGVQNPEERGIELVLTCIERVR